MDLFDTSKDAHLKDDLKNMWHLSTDLLEEELWPKPQNSKNGVLVFWS